MTQKNISPETETETEYLILNSGQQTLVSMLLVAERTLGVTQISLYLAQDEYTRNQITGSCVELEETIADIRMKLGLPERDEDLE